MPRSAPNAYLLLGVLALLLEFPELSWLRLLVDDELEELPLWLALPLEVPPCPGLPLPGVCPEVPVDPETEPEPETDPLPLTLEPWLPLVEPLVTALELELDEPSGCETRGEFIELLSLLELELELEPELPVPPRSAWSHPTNRAAAAATGIMNFFIVLQTSYFKTLTPPTFLRSFDPTMRVLTLRWLRVHAKESIGYVSWSSGGKTGKAARVKARKSANFSKIAAEMPRKAR